MEPINWAHFKMNFNKRRRKFIESKGKCEWCGISESLTLDHKRAICLGGVKWHESNWQVLCNKCNSEVKSKQDNDLYRLLMMCYVPETFKRMRQAELKDFTNEQLLALHKKLSDLLIAKPFSKTNKREKSLLHVTNQLINRGV